VGQLSRAYRKSLLRRGRKKQESREKREWMSMCRRVEEGGTVELVFEMMFVSSRYAYNFKSTFSFWAVCLH